MNSGDDQNKDEFNPYNPYNPYATASEEKAFAKHREPGELKPQFLVVGWIIIVLSALWTAYWIFSITVAFAQDNPALRMEGKDEAERIGALIGIVFVFMPVLFGFIAFLGGICLVRRRNYVLAWLGVVAFMLPLCGPCFGLTIPVGVWAAILLFMKTGRSEFSGTQW